MAPVFFERIKDTIRPNTDPLGLKLGHFEPSSQVLSHCVGLSFYDQVLLHFPCPWVNIVLYCHVSSPKVVDSQDHIDFRRWLADLQGHFLHLPGNMSACVLLSMA